MFANSAWLNVIVSLVCNGALFGIVVFLYRSPRDKEKGKESPSRGPSDNTFINLMKLVSHFFVLSSSLMLLRLCDACR